MRNKKARRRKIMREEEVKRFGNGFAAPVSPLNSS